MPFALKAVFGMAGHYLDATLSAQTRGASFVLSDQVDALERAVESLQAHRVALVGHSIGAHIALQLLRRGTRRQRVIGVVGLYPFLRCNQRSRVQKVLAALVAFRPLTELVALVAGVLSIMPARWKLLLLAPVFSLLGGLGREAQVVTAHWVRPASIRNVCVLGASEFASLAGEPDWGVGVQRPVRLLYGPAEDFWAPGHDADDAAGAGAHVTRDASFGHMFCVTADGSRHLAARTARLLEDMGFTSTS